MTSNARMMFSVHMPLLRTVGPAKTKKRCCIKLFLFLSFTSLMTKFHVCCSVICTEATTAQRRLNIMCYVDSRFYHLLTNYSHSATAKNSDHSIHS